MKLHSVLLASACVLALAVPASAQVSGTIGGGYAHVDAYQLNLNDWNINGAVLASLPGTGFNFQGNGGWSNLSSGALSANEWNGGASVYWSNHLFRAGGTFNYTDFTSSGSGGHLVNYGGFGEFFLGSFTFGEKAGGFNQNGGVRGIYSGSEVVWFPIPDLALSGALDYTTFDNTNFQPQFHELDFSPQVEWLVSEDVPISAYAGYTFANDSGSGLSSNSNILFAGIRLYLNGVESSSLIDRQRNGTANWATSFGPAGTSFGPLGAP
jgi:hypothetical protein